MYDRGLFHKWVPGIVMLALIVFLLFVVMLINPINSGNISQMSASTGVLSEYYMWGTFATIIGMSLVLPFIMRIKMRFRSKELMITALVVMAILSVVVANTQIGEIVVVSCLVFGIFKMVGMIEMILPVRAILSPDGDNNRFYSIFYAISIGSSQIGTFFTSIYALNVGWQALHYYASAILLIAALLCVIFKHDKRFSRKYPFIYIDWKGVLQFATILMSLAYIFAFGKQQDWFNSPYILASIGLVILSIFSLIKRQMHIKHPFLSFKLYKIKDVRYGLLLLVGQGMYMGIGVIASIYTAAILGYNWMTNASLNLMTLPGIVAASFVAFHWTKNNIPIKWYIFSGFAAYFLYTVMLYFMMVPQLNISQLYLPQILNGYGMCALFISVWIYTLRSVPQQDMLPSVAPVMIFRSFFLMALFTALFGWLQYKFQWQSAGDMAYYFDAFMIGQSPAGVASYGQLQLNAILAANKIVLGYAIIAGMGILTFVGLHQFGRQKYTIARYRMFKAERIGIDGALNG